MEQSSERIIRAYVKEVEKNLKCSKALSSVFKKSFLDEIHDFSGQCGSNSEAVTYEALVEHFGSPQEVANGFFDRSDYEALLKKSRKKALL